MTTCSSCSKPSDPIINGHCHMCSATLHDRLKSAIEHLVSEWKQEDETVSIADRLDGILELCKKV